MNTTLYLIRHGQTDGNVKNIYQGHFDAPLNDLGNSQAELLKERFRNVKLDMIISSPLIRTLETAKAININHNLQIVTDEKLMELYGGDLEGMLFPKIATVYPEIEKVWDEKIYDFAAPNGETMRELYARVSEKIDEIVSSNKGKTIAVVTHGCPIKNYLTYISGRSIEHIDEIDWAGNTAVSKIIFDDNLIPDIEFFNDCSHLTPELVSKFKQEGLFYEDTCC